MKLRERELEGIRRGRQALDAALVALGAAPVRENPDWLEAEPVVANLPNVVLERAGAAPFRFVFSQDLDIWVGPFSEVVEITVLDHRLSELQEQIEALLRATVSYCRTKRSHEIALTLPGQEPSRLRISGAATSRPTLEGSYDPYVRVHQRPNTLRCPEARQSLVNLVSVLADPLAQAREWVAGRPGWKRWQDEFFDDLNDAYVAIDDAKGELAPSGAIGDTLHDVAEADAVRRLFSVLEPVLEDVYAHKLSSRRSAAYVIADPRWPAVISAATVAYAALSRWPSTSDPARRGVAS